MIEPVADMTKFDVEIESPTDVLKIAVPGLRMLHEKRHNFDHHLCEKVLEYREFGGERNLRPNHVTYLINCMMRGTFHPEWVTLIACEFGGDTWRMNGQHTTFARLEMPKGWKDAGQVRVQTYEATSYEAMRELYSSIDRGAPRTKGNVINSYLADTDQFEGVPPTLVRLLAEGLSLWLWESGHDRVKHDADEVAWLMQHTHKSLVTTVLTFAMTEPRVLSCELVRRASVIAAMYETFSKVFQDSSDFWNAVRTGVGFASGDDARLRLRNYLQESKVSGRDNRVRAKSVDREGMYRVCILAFNRWRKGEGVKVLAATKERQRAK